MGRTGDVEGEREMASGQGTEDKVWRREGFSIGHFGKGL